MNLTSNEMVLSAPLQKKERILFLDSVRGIALLGILLMNSMAQSQAHFYYDRMDLNQSLTGPNFYAWVAETFFFEGTMRGLFSILFGAGTLLLLGRLVKHMSGLQPADIFYRRMLWLLIFGLINAFVFLWPGDILYPYAICGLVLFPFRNLSAKKLFLIAFAFLIIGIYKENNELYHYKNMVSKGQAIEALDSKKLPLSDDQKADLEKYKGFKERVSPEGISKAAAIEIKKMQSGNYGTIFNYYLDVNMKIESTVFYNGYWPDIFLCFFLGMALFKSGFLLGKKRLPVYIICAIAGIGTGLILNYFVLKTMYNLRFDQYIFVQKWDFSYYQIRRVTQTFGYLSVLIMLYKVIPFRRILNIFVPVGQMAFSNYLMQSIFTSIYFYGFRMFGKLQRYEVYYVVGAIWLFQIIFSHIWLQYFKFGPFEWLWRSLTYQRKQPFLRKRNESLEVIPDVVPLK